MGSIARDPRQIRPPDRANKQGVAREHKPWITAATMIRHQQTDALRRVAGGVQYRHTGIAQFDRLTVVKSGESQRNIRRFIQTVMGSNKLCQR